jgi:hypothetical protein
VNLRIKIRLSVIIDPGILNPASDARKKFTDVVQVLHIDRKDAIKEVWVSAEQALNQNIDLREYG